MDRGLLLLPAPATEELRPAPPVRPASVVENTTIRLKPQ